MRFLALVLVTSTLLNAAEIPKKITAKERAQGYRDHVILAQPHVGRLAEVEAHEAQQRRPVEAKFPRLGDMRVIAVEAAESAWEAVDRLKATGDYEFVEPDFIRERDAVPNDPRLANGDQWALRNTGQNNGLAGADIGAIPAWDTRNDASTVIVAVLDTGIRLTHEDLAGNLWTNPNEIPGNGIDDDHDGYVDDVHGINALAVAGSPQSGDLSDDDGHGTMVAGIIGAVGNNGKGISGVAWKIRIMPLKLADAENGSSVSGFAECIDYAIAHGAQIINYSYGSSYYSQTEYEALRRARDAGIVVVTSGGNFSSNNDTFAHYPSNHLLDNVLGVAATTRRDELASFSNYSAGLLEIAAPGAEIVSTSQTGDSAYRSNDGTSFSAPFVSGSLALLKAQFPTENYHALVNRLLRSADPIPALAGKVMTGGRLNVARALAATTNRPFNDDFSTPGVLSGPSIVTRAHNQYATSEPDEPAHAGQPASGTLWWTWTAPTSGAVAVETGGSSFDTVVAIYTGAALNNLAVVASNDDALSSTASRVSFQATAGTTYSVAVGGKAGATGALVLNLGYVPTNDAFTQATELSGRSLAVTGFNSVSGSEPGEPSPSTAAQKRSVWYKWTCPATSYYSVSIFAYGFDAVGAVYQGAVLENLTQVDTISRLQVNDAAYWRAFQGTTYYIQVDSADGTTGLFDLAIVDAAAFAVGYYPADSSPVYNPTTQYLYAADDYGELVALSFSGTTDFRTGSLTGNLDVQTPAIGPDGNLYVGDDLGYLYAYSPTLTRLWRRDLGYVRVTSSPAIGSDGAIHIHTDDGYLQAFYPDNSFKWRAVVPGESYSSPSIGDDGTIYIGAEDEYVYALSPTDGALKWRFKADGEIYASIALDETGVLYFGTLNGKFYAVNPDGTQRWVFTAGGPISSSAAVNNSYVYFGCYDTNVYALSRTDGTVVWKYATGDEIRASSPVLASDGSVYIGSYDGYIHSIAGNGAGRRTYVTGDYVRSSGLIALNGLFISSGDGRFYAMDLGLSQASSLYWPMFRQNTRRTGRRLPGTAPSIVIPPVSRSVAAGGAVTLAVHAEGADTLTFQWYRNGVPINGATKSTYAVTTASAADVGQYSVQVTNSRGTVTSSAGVLGLTSTAKLVGPGTEFPNIFHAGTGFTYDQILLEGAAAAVTADPGQILRISYIDPDDDIVQVEFSGPGTLTLTLEDVTGPAPPQKYNQAVNYMKGKAHIVITGATENTHLSVFSVGRANAANQAIFQSSTSYDGFADIGSISIASANGKFGGLRTANATYAASRGFTGVYAPNVEFTGPVFVGDIDASDSATPMLVIGSGANVRITGGDLAQTNNRPVQVTGIQQLVFSAGSDSHGNLFNAQTNRGRLEQNGVDVTNSVVVNPTP